MLRLKLKSNQLFRFALKFHLNFVIYDLSRYRNSISKAFHPAKQYNSDFKSEKS